MKICTKAEKMAKGESKFCQILNKPSKNGQKVSKFLKWGEVLANQVTHVTRIILAKNCRNEV